MLRLLQRWDVTVCLKQRSFYSTPVSPEAETSSLWLCYDCRYVGMGDSSWQMMQRFYCRVHRPQPFFLIKGLMVSEMWHRPVRSFLRPPTWIIRSSKVFMRAGGCALCMGCVGVMWHGKIQDMRKLNWDWLLTGRVPCVSPLSVDIREPFIVYEAGCGIWMLMLLGRR